MRMINVGSAIPETAIAHKGLTAQVFIYEIVCTVTSMDSSLITARLRRAGELPMPASRIPFLKKPVIAR